MTATTTSKPRLNRRESRVLQMFDNPIDTQGGILTTSTHRDNLAVRSLERKGIIEVISCNTIRIEGSIHRHFHATPHHEVVIRSRKTEG